MDVNLKRACAIHDISGYGKVSLTAVIPVLSTMGIQVCPMPTAVLSNHTNGYGHFSYVDLTDTLPEFIDHWKRLELSFDSIYSGFLGSKKQIDIVLDFIKDFKKENTLVVVDPVMADNGKFYGTFNGEFAREMKRLVAKADVITPNFTEAAFLLEKEYVPEFISDAEVKVWLKELSDLGPSVPVITSLPDHNGDNKTWVVAYDRKTDTYWKTGCERLPAFYPGTGDVFTSVLTGSLMRNESLPVALDRSVKFVYDCIRYSSETDEPAVNGILLEKKLELLRQPSVPVICKQI